MAKRVLKLPEGSRGEHHPSSGPVVTRRKSKVFKDRKGGSVRATIIVAKKQGSGVERRGVEEADDPWESIADYILDPPLDPMGLLAFAEQNDTLSQMIAAMEINIDGFGQRLVLKDRVRKELGANTDTLPDYVQEELDVGNMFFASCCPDPEMDFTMLRRQTRRDIEAVGWGAWEVFRNPKTGKIAFLYYLPAHTIRLYPRDSKSIRVPYFVPRWVNGRYEYEKRFHRKRFRKFVQVRNGLTIYFKEYGDPRPLNYKTGDYGSTPRSELATEVMFFRQHSPRTPYGLVRYSGQLISMDGSISAENQNVTTLENNNIPSMAILVNNGQLTKGTINRITTFVEEGLQGTGNRSAFLILEAEPNLEESFQQSSQAKIDIKPLKDVQTDDATFEKLRDRSTKGVRRSFRLPEIYEGVLEDTGGKVDVARRLADEQVFDPERKAFDSRMDRTLLVELQIANSQFQSHTPFVTDNMTMIRLLGISEKSGGLSPQVARDVIGGVLNRDLGPVRGIDPDIPFSLQMMGVNRGASGEAPVPGKELSVPGSNASSRSGAATERSLAVKSVSGQNLDDIDPDVLTSLYHLRDSLERVVGEGDVDILIP